MKKLVLFSAIVAAISFAACNQNKQEAPAEDAIVVTEAPAEEPAAETTEVPADSVAVEAATEVVAE
jgi:uncharacterized lipoprotein YbaY